MRALKVTFSFINNFNNHTQKSCLNIPAYKVRLKMLVKFTSSDVKKTISRCGVGFDGKWLKGFQSLIGFILNLTIVSFH